MREDKNKAYILRRQKKSLNYISRELNISKGTLSGWFKEKKWSMNVTRFNRRENILESKNRIEQLNSFRKISLAKSYNNARNKANNQFDSYKQDILFIAGLMLYAGEGDKNPNTSNIRISNIDPILLNIFKKFLLKYMPEIKDKLKFWMLLYPDLNERKCKLEWQKKLDLSSADFYKSQIIRGKSNFNRLIYGVGNITISNKYFKTKLLEWIKIASENLSAGVV